MRELQNSSLVSETVAHPKYWLSVHLFFILHLCVRDRRFIQLNVLSLYVGDNLDEPLSTFSSPRADSRNVQGFIAFFSSLAQVSSPCFSMCFRYSFKLAQVHACRLTQFYVPN